MATPARSVSLLISFSRLKKITQSTSVASANLYPRNTKGGPSATPTLVKANEIPQNAVPRINRHRYV